MRPKVIVVGVDFEAAGDEALRAGLEQLATGAAQAMHVVHALALPSPLPREEPEPDPDAHTVAVVLETLAHRVSAIAGRAHLPYHAELIRCEVRAMQPSEALLAAAREHHASSIVVGTHGRHGLERLFLGSVAERVIRDAPCSVLVVRPERPDQSNAEHVPGGTAAEAFDNRGAKPWRQIDVP